MEEDQQTRSNDSSVVKRQEATVVTIPRENGLLTNRNAMMHLIKSTIGGGFLAMPQAFHNAGIVMGILGTLFLGICVLDMMVFIVRTSQQLRSGKYAKAILNEKNRNSGHGSDEKLPPEMFKSNELILPPLDYPGLVSAVFKHGARGFFAPLSRYSKIFSCVLLVATYYGVNIIYVCILGGSSKQLTDEFTQSAEVAWYTPLNSISINYYPLIVAVFIIPIGMLQSLKFLSMVSTVANGCMMAGTASILFYILFGEAQNPLEPEQQPKWIVWPMERWSLFSGSALCSLEGVGMLLHVENKMEEPLGLAGPPQYTLHKTMLFIVFLNGIFGLCGYARFGDTSQGSIAMNLPPGNFLSYAVRIVVGIGILLTYGLQLNITADVLWKSIFKKLIFKYVRQGSDEELKWYYRSMRFSLIVGTIIIAMIKPDISSLIELVGSVGFSILGIILPVILDTIWNWYPEDHYLDSDDPECDIRAVIEENVERRRIVINYYFIFRLVNYIKNAIIFFLGIFALVGGVYYNLNHEVSKETPSQTAV